MKHPFAIVGFGNMGEWHAGHVSASETASLAGIYDIDPERVSYAGEKGYHAFESLQDVIASEAETVIVATPNHTHCGIVCELLAGGKNVIVEKPAALNIGELEQMYAAAEKAGKLFSVHQNRRWDSDFCAIRKVIQSGAVGQVFNLESRIHGSRGIPSKWRRVPECGGGMVYDWGEHLIDQVLLAYEGMQLKTVECTLNHWTETAVDDGFYLTLGFENDARAFIEVNTCNFIAMPRFYLTGSKGSAIITDWRIPCQVTECFAWNEADVMPEVRDVGITKTMAARDEKTTKTYSIERPKAGGFEYLDNYCAAMEGKESLLVTKAQALRVQQIIDAAFESAKAGKPVPVC